MLLNEILNHWHLLKVAMRRFFLENMPFDKDTRTRPWQMFNKNVLYINVNFHKSIRDSGVPSYEPLLNAHSLGP